MINRKYNKNLILLLLKVPQNPVSIVKSILINIRPLIRLVAKFRIERLINTKP
jgi:hypothetical protein